MREELSESDIVRTCLGIGLGAMIGLSFGICHPLVPAAPVAQSATSLATLHEWGMVIALGGTNPVEVEATNVLIITLSDDKMPLCVPRLSEAQWQKLAALFPIVRQWQSTNAAWIKP